MDVVAWGGPGGRPGPGWGFRCCGRAAAAQDAWWVSLQTVCRRFAQGSRERVRARLHRVTLDELGARGELDWPRWRHPAPHCPQGGRVSRRLGRHRWVVERTASWPAGCRRLHRRYERKAEHFLAFVGMAAALIGHRRLIR
ncbi:hypothetical protein EF906_16700 [Streptomyces sp. WAC08241]|nr:hypothetical protein EF906_16700 [Streptomyces sp. WAC08241]